MSSGKWYSASDMFNKKTNIEIDVIKLQYVKLTHTHTQTVCSYSIVTVSSLHSKTQLIQNGLCKNHIIWSMLHSPALIRWCYVLFNTVNIKYGSSVIWSHVTDFRLLHSFMQSNSSIHSHFLYSAPPGITQNCDSSWSWAAANIQLLASSVHDREQQILHCHATVTEATKIQLYVHMH